jgi:hypothetical protein
LHQANQARLEIVSQVGALGNRLRTEGAVAKWFEEADSALATATADVNGPLLEALADLIGYHDCAAVDMLKFGGPLAGELLRTGNGTACDPIQEMSLEHLKENRRRNNMCIVSRLREDDHSQALFDKCQEDAALGRMTPPRELKDEDLDALHLAPRFGVEQGLKDDGSLKVRPIDDMSASGVNAATAATEKLRYDTIDMLFETLRRLQAVTQAPLCMCLCLVLVAPSVSVACRRVICFGCLKQMSMRLSAEW